MAFVAVETNADLDLLRCDLLATETLRRHLCCFSESCVGSARGSSAHRQPQLSPVVLAIRLERFCTSERKSTGQAARRAVTAVAPRGPARTDSHANAIAATTEPEPAVLRPPA